MCCNEVLRKMCAVLEYYKDYENSLYQVCCEPSTAGDILILRNQENAIFIYL